MLKRLISLFMCLLALQWAAPATAAEALTDYRLAHGDVLHINIMEQPTLINPGGGLQNIYIRPDGYINLPLVGDVYVAGLMVKEVVQILTRYYSPFFKTPHITLAVVTFRSLPTGVNITVIGKVARSGTFNFTTPPTIFDAIAAAGGFSERADRSQVRVFNKLSSGEIRVVNYNRILVDKKIDQIMLKHGDVIEVPAEGWPDFYQLAPVLLGVTSVIVSIILLTRAR